jgi:hypothetical protein
MAKPIPLEYGKYYQIYNRGNNGENIFIKERNYQHFLNLYAKYILPIADTYAYNLLRNHFHLFVTIKTLSEQEEWFYQELSKTPDVYPKPVWKPKKPSQQFGNLFNAYAKAINNAYYRTGSLFEHPFKRIEVTTPSYFRRLIIYIHQNAQLHGFVEDFRDWPHSSYHTHLSNKRSRLKREQVLSHFGQVHDFETIHQDILNWDEVSVLAPEDFHWA